MSRLPLLLVLNPTCLDVIESQREWIEAQGVALRADQANRQLTVEQVGEALKGCDGVLLPSAIRNLPTAEQMAAAPDLLVCSIAASGFEWLDVDAATRNGIVVTYAPAGEGAAVVADLAWGLLLAAARQIVHHHNLLSRGDATRGMGAGLSGKTLGIIGLGAIGREVALRGKGFRMRLLASDPAADPTFAAANGVELTSLERLLEESDFVSLHVRLTEQTRGMIGAPELSRMKPSAFIVNAARQELIDERALVNAISARRLAGAGLDDPPGPDGKALFGHPNVVFTPHLGNRAIDGVVAVFRSAIESAAAVLRGERPRFVVNPEVYERGVRRPRGAEH
ncbi:MAG TPA: NAD(P)-dependent oxidoreductase [Tepidisphaeraceae bacterium]|nr:NAD(P)-dependent oxidoreductase [Tepidisphaeraceae bacterium]